MLVTELKNNFRLIFVGSPYTRYKTGLYEAFTDISKAVAFLVERQVPLYSPIIHFHPIAVHGGLNALDADLWMKAARPVLEASDALLVVMLNGWDKSEGLAKEVQEFSDRELPVMYWTPGSDNVGFLTKRAR